MPSPRFSTFSLATALLLLASPYLTAHAQSFTEVAVGKSHVCALTDTGEVECATDAITKRYDAPDDLPLMKALAAGQQHTCGITLEGDAVCWGGLNFYQEQDVPEISQPLVGISAGVLHTCAVDESNRVWCWGLDSNQQTQVPGDGYGENAQGFIKVSTNQNASCGIETNGSITCWSTDPRLSDTSSLTGNFVDLDMSDFSVCGLRDNGSIQCIGAIFEPPGSGPYTDLVVGIAAICGLNQSQTLDCTFNPQIPSIDQSLFETNAQFTSLDSHDFRGDRRTLNTCGVTVNATIECLEESSLFAVPGMEPPTVENTDLTTKLSLTAAIFSQDRFELFWTPLSGTTPITRVEIYRNDELVNTVNARFSYWDRDFDLNQTVADYRVRAIDESGNVGAFSNTITVDVLNNTVTGTSGLSFEDMPEPARLINKISLQTVSSNIALISWEGPMSGEAGVVGYEIRVNNETIGITDSNTYLLTDFDGRDCFIYSIAALSANKTYLDFRSLTYVSGQNRNTLNCRRG